MAKIFQHCSRKSSSSHCQGVDVVMFIDCLIEQEGKAKERRKREEGKKRRSGRSGILTENPTV